MKHGLMLGRHMPIPYENKSTLLYTGEWEWLDKHTIGWFYQNPLPPISKLLRKKYNEV